MKFLENIVINENILKDIVIEAVKKVPGVSSKKPVVVNISKQKVVFNISFTPVEEITNIVGLCFEIQARLFYLLAKQFDTRKIAINVSV